MIDSRKLNNFWSYLPAFRAIAETERLTDAAAQLGVVPSALSRSLGLLEDRLGERLFSRQGGRLSLNHRGRALLEAVRRGMQAIERGATQALGSEFEGEYRVGTIGVLTNHVVLPCLLELARAHGGVVPVMRNCRPVEANHRLVLGDLHVAFCYDAVPFEGVAFRKLGDLSSAVYCGRAHPLFRARRVDRAALLRHAFSIPTLGDRNTSMDGWPVDVERRVGFHIELLATNLEVCRSGRFLTVLPDVVARPHLRSGELRRFPVSFLPPIEVFAAWRAGEEEGWPNRELVAAVEREVRAAAAGR